MHATTLRPDIRLTVDAAATVDPVSTPEKFRPGRCHLELTPVWQYVIKRNRFPADVDRQDVFSELAVRLQHPEWQVRLHGSRVLAYVIPAVGSQLDALMSPAILPAVITNLAHFSPALRSSSMDAILVYVQHSLDPEFVLKSMIVQGLDISGAKSSLTVNVMECIPVVLRQIVKRNGERPIAIPTFVHLVTALSNKMVQATFQQAAVYCLDRVKEIVGRNKFDHYLETFHPIIKKDFEVLCEVYRISSSASGRDSSISSYDDEDDVEIPKTPRRVTFGGELIKIRSPDVSDDPEVIKSTGIPIPVKPALNLPKHPKDDMDTKSTKLQHSRQTKFRHSGNYSYHKRTIDHVRPNTLPPLRHSNFKQFSNSQINPLLYPFRRKLDDRISFNRGLFSPHAIICVGRTDGSFNKNYKNTKNMQMDESNKKMPPSGYAIGQARCGGYMVCKRTGYWPVDSPYDKAKLAVTVGPEPQREQETAEDESPRGKANGTGSADGEDATRPPRPPTPGGDLSAASASSRDGPADAAKSEGDGDGGSGGGTQYAKADDRAIRVNGKTSLSHTSVTGFTRPNVQSKNDKPIAEVKPTTSAVQPSLPRSTDRKRYAAVPLKKQEKRQNADEGVNLTPFNDPQKALQLVSTQINSVEWGVAVTGLQNISRLSMFHGKELRPNALQPFTRIVAKHIKSLRSQVARAACMAAQKMFTHVPKSVEPDVEVIVSALFPRTADTNKFLRVQSSDAFDAMVDNLNPIKTIHVITSKGIKHGNCLVRAEACRLLARLVDKLGTTGTLHLPTDSRDAVISSATNMVSDNTATSRQAAQHILAKLSEDPRGAALITSAASPNVKATLNKSLSRIFLK